MKDLILEKILRQSQLTGIKALIELSTIDKKEKIVDKINEIYSWNEIVWEMHWQESKRNIALEFKIMELKKEIEQLKMGLEL